jgi:hypothetical protein
MEFRIVDTVRLRGEDSNWIFVPSSPILVTLMKEAPRSSETSVLTRATRPNIPEDNILHSHRRENLKSYIPVNSPHYFSIVRLQDDQCMKRLPRMCTEVATLLHNSRRLVAGFPPRRPGFDLGSNNV